MTIKIRKYTINVKEKKALSGTIECSGAKNVAIKAMIISLLSKEITTLHNVPYIGDVDTTITLLESLNVKITKKEYQAHQTLIIDPSKKNNVSHLEVANRASISLFGIFAHFADEFDCDTVLPSMDGCKLGSRDVNFHLHIYEQFGLKIEQIIEEAANANNNNESNKQISRLKMHKPFKGKLSGQIIKLPYPSVGATETALFLGVLAKGKTIIENIATEPEIMEVITMLQMMGAEIIFTSKRNIEIYGVDTGVDAEIDNRTGLTDRLSEESKVIEASKGKNDLPGLRGVEFEIMPDRLEIVTWAVLAAISNGSITVKHTRLTYLHTFLGYYQHIGGGTKYIDNSTVTFYKAKPLSMANISTAIYPSLATDQLAQLAVMLGFAKGISTLHETVYENRVNVISEMFNMFGIASTPYNICLGQECRFSGHNYIHSLAIYGKEIGKDSGKEIGKETDAMFMIHAPKEPIVLPKNIRCAHAYLLLASQAKGTTVLLDPSDSVHRGYGAEEIVEKMQQIGIDITQELV